MCVCAVCVRESVPACVCVRASVSVCVLVFEAGCVSTVSVCVLMVLIASSLKLDCFFSRMDRLIFLADFVW